MFRSVIAVVLGVLLSGCTVKIQPGDEAVTKTDFIAGLNAVASSTSKENQKRKQAVAAAFVDVLKRVKALEDRATP